MNQSGNQGTRIGRTYHPRAILSPLPGFLASRFVFRFVSYFLLSTFYFAVLGCSHHQSALTIAPHSVVSTSASFDENSRNSGLISSDATGFLVTQHFIERHQVNTTDHGVTAEGANYRITAQIMARCIEFDRLRKNAQK